MAYVKSVLDFQAEAAKRGIRTSFRFVANEALIVRARNELTWAFLQSDATHLLFIDADIGFEPQAPFRLFEFNREVSAAAYRSSISIGRRYGERSRRSAPTWRRHRSILPSGGWTMRKSWYAAMALRKCAMRLPAF